MKTTQKLRAFVCGHTGATGNALLETLTASSSCESIVAIGRRENKAMKNAAKLTQHIIPDMLKIAQVDNALIKDCNVAFCCIGTTFNDVFKNSKAAEYQSVDFGIATEFAKVAKASGVEFFCIITGDKSDSQSSHRMTRVKGETEDFVNSLGFNRVAILQPGLLNRGKGRRGWLEQIFTVGGTFGLPVSKIGEAMTWMALNQTDSLAYYNTKDIRNAASEFKKTATQKRR